MNRVGFLARHTKANKSNKYNDKHNCVLVCDSGNSISFEDARHHILAMGTTGSGKTASVVLPVLLRLIEAGHCGLVVDIKGNLREQVRSIARHCGREADVVEFGSAPSAMPLNLLSDMTMHDVRSYLEALTMQHFKESSHNKDFHMKGVHQATDCVQLLRYLALRNTAFEPSLSLLDELLNDYGQASTAFSLFTDSMYDEKNAKQRRFVQRIRNNEFHVLNYDAQSAKRGSSYMEQVNYALQGTRIALAAFMDAPGIARGFATQGAPGLEMRRLLKQRKIILLRFGPDTGPTGADLARVVLREYYKAVFADGLSMPEGAYSFTCLDEFQDFADLGAGRFSDSNFIAQAREFRAIFLASTQSMSSLAIRDVSPAAVDAFVSNCNTRILFYSDDPRTRNMAMQYDPTISLSALQSGQAFMVQYDTQSRNHSFGVESLHQAYAAARDVLAQNPVPLVTETPEDQQNSRLDLMELLEQEAAKRAPEKKAPVPGHSVHKEKNLALSAIKQASDKLFDGAFVEIEKVNEFIEHLAGRPDAERANEEGAERLRRLFPQYFMTDGNVFMAVPAGWLDYAEKALRAFEHCGLALRISTMAEMHGALVVSVTDSDSRAGGRMFSRHVAERIMNALLQGTKELCPLCGEHIPRQRNQNLQETSLRVCYACLAKHGLLSAKKQQRWAEKSGKLS